MKRCHSCNNVELLTKAMFCSECGNKFPLSKKFSIRRRLVNRKGSVLILIILMPFLMGITPNNPFLLGASAYNIFEDNSVDADSDIDANVNIGTDGATSYLNAQTVNADDQIITEGNGAGYSAGTDEDELHDAITNNHAPVDLGTYSNDADMLSDNSVYNTLTEEDTGGGGGGQVQVNPTGALEDQITTYSDVDASPTNDACYYDSTNTTKCGRISKAPDMMVRVEFSSGYSNLAVDDSFYAYYVKDRSSGAEDNVICPYSSSTGIATGNCLVDVGAIGTGWSPAFTITAGFLTDLFDQGSGAFAIRYMSVITWGSDYAFTDAMEIGEFYGLLSQGGGSNYEFDREFSFTSIATLDGDTETLAINTGTMGTESLIVQIWEASAWTTVVTLVDANDNVWVNTSIATWMDSTTEDFRFLGGTETSDTTLNTWEIDMILIHNVKNDILDYELQWEHQSTSVDPNKDSYNLTIYGFATENMEIQTWDIGGTTWNTPLSLVISTTVQWYNQTIDANAIGTSITWRYRGTAETGDTSQSTLNIDYAGIAAWNHTMDIIETTFGISDYKQDSGNISITENPIRINVTSGISYTIEVSATDGSGTPIANLYLFMDTDSNPVGAIQLTTSWQVMYSGLSPADGSISFIYLWLDVPFGVNDQVLTMTLNVRIIPA